MSEPDWRQFEKAVAEFITAVGEGAEVTHDAKVPDTHTGTPRQRDVWVEWTLGGHFPVKALVSCKYLSSVLDQQDIDHFNGEFQSSGAQIGIIYSRSGFNDRALEKCRSLGFHCCRLYQDEAPDIPESLVFGLAYCARAKASLRVEGVSNEWGFDTWSDVLTLEVDGEPLIDSFRNALDKYQKPNDRYNRALSGEVVSKQVVEGSKPPFNIELTISDDTYRARLEFSKISGSYNLTAGSFIGSQAMPAMDMWMEHPGEGWESCELPEKLPDPYMIAYSLLNAERYFQNASERKFVLDRDT